MSVPTPADLSEFDKSLDEYKVEVMVYEPHLDAPWVYLYRDDPVWVIESGDDDLVVFSRNPEIAFDRKDLSMNTGTAKANRKPILPPMILLIALVLMLVFYWIVPGLRLIPTPWNLSGLIPLGLGLWLSYAAEAQFRRVKTPLSPFEIPVTLVRDGMYRFSRNPMYLGFAGILLGVALMLGSLSPALVVPIFIILMDNRFIRMEEGVMAERFQGEWDTYAQKVRRWI